MDGLAAARALTADVPVEPRRRFVVGTATARDDADIRRLLRESAFPGSVRLSFEREPDSLAVRIEGDVHQVIVARERHGSRIAAIASRSSRLRFVNGQPVRVGYLGQLRIARGFRAGRELLGDGFRYCRALHARDDAALYLASVVRENESVRRLLERGLPGWPSFRRVDDLVTLAIPAGGGRQRGLSGVQIIGTDTIDPCELADLLARNNRRHQFAPCWTAGDLSSQPGLGQGDVLVAVRHGRLAGVAALWDQRAFKQVVVRGYSRSLERVRPLINGIGRFAGMPALPPVGSSLALACLSHAAVDGDDPAVMGALVAAARRAARERGLDYITLGMSSRSPLYEPLRRRFACRSYASVLYAVAWPDGEPVVATLDGRPSYPEMAIL